MVFEEAAPLFSPATPAVTSSSSIFSGPKPTSAPTPGQMTFDDSQKASDAAAAEEKHAEDATPAAQGVSHLGHLHDQHEPLHMQDNKETSNIPGISVIHAEPEEPVGHTENPSAVQEDEEEASEREPSGCKLLGFLLKALPSTST